MYCKLNHNFDCDCCGVCRGEQEEERVPIPVSASCYLCECQLDEDDECYVILNKIICQDCVSNSYFETLKEAFDEDAR